MSGIFTDEEYKPSNDELVKIRDQLGIKRPSWIKRLPVIRHIRATILCYKINRHYDQWAQIGAIPWGANLEYKVCNAIWNNALLKDDAQ